MLVLRSDLVDDIVAHARREHPLESCGQLVGPESTGGTDGGRPERYVAMTNTDGVESDFAFSPQEDIRLERELAGRDERRMVVVHSHTRVPRRPLTDTGLPEAYPSEKDIEFMGWTPDQYWLIVGLSAADAEPDLRSYRLVDGEVAEEPIQVVESYMFAHTGSDDVPDHG